MTQNQYIVYLYPLTFDFSADTTIYSSVDMGTYEALTQKYMIRLLNEYGVNNSREIANNILSMKREIASKSKKIKDLNDYKGYYNIINENELQNYYSNIDVSKYLKIKGIRNEKIHTFVCRDGSGSNDCKSRSRVCVRCRC